MRYFLCALFAVLFNYSAASAQSLAQTDATARAAHRQIAARKIVLVGDSTVQVNSGWGGQFCATHLLASVSCVNLSRGGRSSFSFRAEGSWQLALNEMRTAGYEKTYVLIQFGHNDMPGKPGRSTELASEYPIFIRQYVIEARTAGAIPVLVTPLVRRSFKEGKIKNDLAPWAEAVRQVARDENVPLLDLNAASASAIEEMGAVAALGLAQAAPSQELIDAAATGTTIEAPRPPQVSAPAPMNCDLAPSTQNCTIVAPISAGLPRGSFNSSFDYTHLGENGAKFVAVIVARELTRAVPELSNYVIP